MKNKPKFPFKSEQEPKRDGRKPKFGAPAQKFKQGSRMGKRGC